MAKINANRTTERFAQFQSCLTDNTNAERLEIISPILNVLQPTNALPNTGDIFKAVMTEEKFTKSERYKINRKHFHSRITDPVVRLGCSLS